eukprot:7714742-Pyramimonas_sp.AAC.1
MGRARLVEQGPAVLALLEDYHELLLEPENVPRTKTMFLEHGPDASKHDSLSRTFSENISCGPHK